MPDSPANHPRRQHPRFDVRVVVEVRAEGWSEVLHLATENISRGGLFIRSEHPVELGTALRITLKLPDDAELTVGGSVAHVISRKRAGSEGLATGFGVRFAPQHATDLNLLAAMAAANLGDQTTYHIDAKYMSLPTVVLDLVAESSETTTGHVRAGPVTDEHPAVAVPSPTGEEPIAIRDTPPLRGELLAAADVAQAERIAGVPRLPSAALAADLVDPDQAVFGIDFGTSFSSISLFTPRGVRVCEDAQGNTMFPSVVSFVEQGPPVVGWEALEQLALHPMTTFISPKRIIGRRYDDHRIDPFLDASPIITRAGPGGEVLAEIYGEPISIPQVVAEIFRHLALVGEVSCALPVRRVVLSVPVHYREERAAIQRAAELAGLEVVTLLEEPVAAAMAYGLGHEEAVAAIYDLGGSTFDFTLVEVNAGRFKVMRRAGDAWLGGDDFDRVLAEHAAEAFRQRYKVDLRQRTLEWKRLLMHCEAAKRKLSFQYETRFVARGMAISLRGPLDLAARFDRRLLARLCGPLVDRSIEVADVCLSFAGMAPTDVSAVVLVGGTCRMPLVRERLEDYFQREITLPVDPEHAVVVGAAIGGRFSALATGRTSGSYALEM